MGLQRKDPPYRFPAIVSDEQKGPLRRAEAPDQAMTGRQEDEQPKSQRNVLVLVRHGESEWNRLNRFTGSKDVGLTEEGLFEAHRAGAMLEAEGLRFDLAFTSTLKRAQHTLRIILDELEQEDIPTVKDAALNERDYGELMGINKDEARLRWGAEQVHLWQRSYDIAPPGGESLKDTGQRVIPFFDKRIVPELRAGKSVIVVAHGNSLRTLIMQLDCLTPEDVEKVELRTGHPLIYKLNADGTIAEKRDIAA